MWLRRTDRSIRQSLKSYQFVSDLHLDRNGHPRLKPVAKNLIVAGDLADGWTHHSINWLKGISQSFDKIFVVLGNHEYYGNFKENLQRVHETTSTVSNLKILDDSRENIYLDHDEKVVLYGTTLWSKIPKEYHKYYLNSGGDFRKISNPNGGNGKLTPEMQNKLHLRSISKLSTSFKMLEMNIEYQSCSYIPIVVTHYSPLIKGCCHSRYYQNRVRSKNHMYCTDLSGLMLTLGLFHNPFWIFGHTHYHTNTMMNDVFLGSNPVGFPTLTKNGPKVREKTLYDLYQKNFVKKENFNFSDKN